MKLADELDRLPTEEEVASELHLPARKLRIVKKALRIYNHSTFSPSEENEFSFGHAMPTAVTDTPDAGLVHQEELRDVLTKIDMLENSDCRR